jgi:hypothetical protein
MSNLISKLNLSHGQVLWALSRGLPASQLTIDQVRNLRLLGVPFGTDHLGLGRGNRARYRFDHLIELGIALFAIRQGMKRQDVAALLTKNRKRFRELYRQAFENQPEAAINEEWVKSRGRLTPILGDETFLRLHDRYSEAPGTFDILPPNQGFGLSESYPGEKTRMLLPLTRLVLELTAWAAEAPETRPGPAKSSK